MKSEENKDPEFVYRAQLVKLKPTKEQEVLLEKCVGTSRFVFNKTLHNAIKTYEKNGKSMDFMAFKRALTSVKEEKFPWMYELPKTVVQHAINNVQTAYKNFFRRVKQGGAPGFPKFKKKGRSRDSARIDNGPGSFSFTSEGILCRQKDGLFKIFGDGPRWPEAKQMSCTVSREPSGWYASVMFKIPLESVLKRNPNPNKAVGIDLGVAQPLSLYSKTGWTQFYGKKVSEDLKKKEVKLARYQRMLARRTLGGKNWNKTKVKIQRLHETMRNVRKDFQEKTSNRIAKGYELISFEDLSLRNMTKQVRKNEDGTPRKSVAAKSGLNRSLLRMGLSRLVARTEQKSHDWGHLMVKVNPRYTSQTCSECGVIDSESRKNQAKFKCVHCNFAWNADLNAAKNILARGEVAKKELGLKAKLLAA